MRRSNLFNQCPEKKESTAVFKTLAVCASVLLTSTTLAQKDDERGLILNTPQAYPGLNLFSPLESGSTYLIDNEGRVINTWESEFRPSAVYLLPNGHILRTAGYGLAGNGTFFGGGAGYRLEQFDWDGAKVWEYVYASDKHLMHHDVEPLPNGNVLILAWELKTKEECIAAGRNPEALRDDKLWSEHIIEVKPTLPEGGEIVWEWHLWDHLVQDFDESKANYGDVAANPQLLDIDPPGFWMDRISPEELEQLESLGYVAGEEREKQKQPERRGGNADWLHANAVAYNPQHDLIAISALGNNEIWVIDHSTTTEQARGHTGGTYGKGGDFLYRWGNPLAYRLGTEADQRLFAQHNIHWIDEGLPGAGDLLVFNNGRGRPGGQFSSVDQFQAPFTPGKGFHREDGKAWGPADPVWQYTAPKKEDFNSFFISGAQRLPNGNTLVCAGAQGTFFEVTADKQEVWRYVNPANPPAPARAEAATDSQNNRPGFLRFTVFRVTRYPLDYPAFAGKDLTPGPLLTDYLKDHPAKTPRELKDDFPGE